jgi:hypothetical protein
MGVGADGKDTEAGGVKSGMALGPGPDPLSSHSDTSRSDGTAQKQTNISMVLVGTLSQLVVS